MASLISCHGGDKALRFYACLVACALSACSAPAPSAEEPVAPPAPQETPLPSPDTSRAIWSVGPSGHALQFGNRDTPPWLTLDCRLSASAPPQLAIIRHASGLPGQTALFAVMGNGHVARLPADAVLNENEWRWESVVAAADPRMDLFIGPGDMRATLPGKGAIAIPPSPIPGQFVEWCRRGGRPAPSATPTPG